MYGIPQFRLPKEIVKHEIDALKDLGVKIIPNAVIGRTFTIKELMDDVNVKLHVDKTTSTATHLDVVAYFAAGETYQKGDNFYFTVYDGGGEGREPYAVAIQPRTYAPVRTLTAADGEVVRISAVGITMDNASPGRELTAQELTLHYADGTSDVVTSESQNLMNWVLGYIYGDGETAPFAHAVYIFNRMVDVDTVTSVSFDGRWFDFTAEQHIPVQLTYLP